jgi:UDP-N-acetylmuramate--alanine ligase
VDTALDPLAVLPPGFLDTPRRAHLVGIGGAGMQALARVLLARGWMISGTDLAAHVPQWLTAAGVPVARGHVADSLPDDAELLIYSDAVNAHVPERRRAAARGMPQLSYPMMLGHLMADRRVLAVAGTHGKSTTTAMAASILAAAGLNFTAVYGATPIHEQLHQLDRVGDDERFLVEACEYRANFLHLTPQVAAILNIEHDHFDCFETAEDVEAAFREFITRLPNDGLLVAQHDCRTTQRVSQAAACRVETFGYDPAAAWRAERIIDHRGRYQFDLWHNQNLLGRATLCIPGAHQVLNALAAATIASAAGAAPEAILQGLATFRGLRRRLETIGTWQGVTLIDDYAHHPTEVTAALAAVRKLYPQRRIWCIFQPHQASRTARLLDELTASLHNADRVAVAEIFRAREPAWQPGDVTAADLASRVRASGVETLDVHETDEILEQVDAAIVPGDVVVTMGAGDIRKVADGIADRFRKVRAAG